MVYIDEEECIGCGTCEEICPEVFKLSDEKGKAEVINEARRTGRWIFPTPPVRQRDHFKGRCYLELTF